MILKQYFDKGLAHMSYAIVSDGEMAVIDPGRDPQPYLDFAKENKAEIVIVFETHPHADFVSSHLEIHKHTGATIYCSEHTGAKYPHKALTEGDKVSLGKLSFLALETPGHSPDSISILLLDENGKEYAVFTGDTLFVGDVGRPDLRENTGKLRALKEKMAGQLYHSLHEKLMKLPDTTLVYPAHGPGSLCGKSMSPKLSSTIGKEKSENYALVKMSESDFINILLENQPFIPAYFPYDVEVNRKGAKDFEKSIQKVPIIELHPDIPKGTRVIDARPENLFKRGHLKGAINIPNGLKFETWLGTIIKPEESFYLIAEDENTVTELLKKTAKIGYENHISGAVAISDIKGNSKPILDLDDFKSHPDHYTIVDVRNKSEVKVNKIFENRINIPLAELKDRTNEIPSKKPIVTHCGGGYRSAIGSSIIQASCDLSVYDLGEKIKYFS